MMGKAKGEDEKEEDSMFFNFKTDLAQSGCRVCVVSARCLLTRLFGFLWLALPCNCVTCSVGDTSASASDESTRALGLRLVST